MKAERRKRPFLATVICIVMAFMLASWLFHMLPGHHRIPMPGSIVVPMPSPWFLYTMGMIDFVAIVGGIVALWGMRPIAAVFFAVQAISDVIQLAEGVFFRHTLEALRMSMANRHRSGGFPTIAPHADWMISFFVFFLAVAFPVVLFLYVWRVTRECEKKSVAV